jgi:hypothetical protein
MKILQTHIVTLSLDDFQLKIYNVVRIKRGLKYI